MVPFFFFPFLRSLGREFSLSLYLSPPLWVAIEVQSGVARSFFRTFLPFLGGGYPKSCLFPPPLFFLRYISAESGHPHSFLFLFLLLLTGLWSWLPPFPLVLYMVAGKRVFLIILPPVFFFLGVALSFFSLQKNHVNPSRLFQFLFSLPPLLSLHGRRGCPLNAKGYVLLSFFLFVFFLYSTFAHLPPSLSKQDFASFSRGLRRTIIAFFLATKGACFQIIAFFLFLCSLRNRIFPAFLFLCWALDHGPGVFRSLSLRGVFSPCVSRQVVKRFFFFPLICAFHDGLPPPEIHFPFFLFFFPRPVTDVS